ncbi:MAG: GntR family transcriptional regulator [Thermodesulfobacteriota bacterium]
MKVITPDFMEPKMDHPKRVPLYRQVAETVRGRILSGQYKSGERIPSVHELEAEFEVSNITIRKALSLLSQEGLIESRQGVGTLAAPTQEEIVRIEITGNFKDWLDSASGRNPKLEAAVLEMVYTSGPKRIHQLLGAPMNEKLFRMKRVRSFRGQPISFFVNFSALEGCRHIRREEVEARSFIEVFQKACAIRLTHLEQHVRAVTADLDVASILKIDFGAPLFFVENIYYTSADKPVQVTHMYYRGDRYMYKARIPLA